MNTKLFLRASVVVFLLALGGVAAASAPLPPDRPAPRDPMAAQTQEEQPAAAEPRQPAVAVSPILQYQGRLTNPATGQPVPDGVLAMTFRLYTAASGGSPVWQEVKNVQVSGGLFSTGLGDTAALPQTLFDGQALWLGVKVGADLEAIPRQPLQPVAYALGLLPGAVISASSAAPALEVANLSTGVRVTSTTGVGLRGETASILAGRAGVLGLAGEPAMDPPDEAGVLGKSLDGLGVAGLSLNDTGVYGYSANSDGVWGVSAGVGGAGVYGAHFGNGWGGYFYSANGTALAANSTTGFGAFFGSGVGQAIYASGSVTVTGDLNAFGSVRTQRVEYISPRIQEFSVGGEGFVPGSNVDYFNTYGNGGAYIAVATSGGMVAPVHLPNGARVIGLTVFTYDGSSSDLSVWLARLSLASGGYAIMADIDTAGVPGYSSWTDTTIGASTIDNTAFAYHIYAYSPAWDGGNLRIMGARVTYEMVEAP